MINRGARIPDPALRYVDSILPGDKVWGKTVEGRGITSKGKVTLIFTDGSVSAAMSKTDKVRVSA
jgi:hypothetical protein